MAIITKCINPECGKEFETIPALLKRGHGKYCSRECASTVRTDPKTSDVRKFFYDFPFAQNKECAAHLGLSIDRVNRLKSMIRKAEIVKYRRKWGKKL